MQLCERSQVQRSFTQTQWSTAMPLPGHIDYSCQASTEAAVGLPAEMIESIADEIINMIVQCEPKGRPWIRHDMHNTIYGAIDLLDTVIPYLYQIHRIDDGSGTTSPEIARIASGATRCRQLNTPLYHAIAHRVAEVAKSRNFDTRIQRRQL